MLIGDLAAQTGLSAKAIRFYEQAGLMPAPHAHRLPQLFAWAVHHRLTGGQAASWPAEIDVFLAVGELALYVAYLDGWPARQRVWPWATTLTGLAVSVAGNIGHIQPLPGHPVLLADRLTAAAGPAILLPDEATAALDLAAEAAVNRATERLTARRTTVVVAHLLTPAARADRIVVMETGKIAEVGTHAELLERDGGCAALWAAWEHPSGLDLAHVCRYRSSARTSPAVR